MSLIHHPNLAIKNLLTCYFDIANKKSYVGTGTTVLDLTRNKYNGGTFGSITYSTLYGGIFSFATSSRINLNAGGQPSGSTNNPFTLELWVRVSSLSTNNALLSQPAGVNLMIDTTGAVVSKFGGNNRAVTASSLINAGQWYNIIFTRNTGGGYAIYINARLYASTANVADNLVTTAGCIGYISSSNGSLVGDMGIYRFYKTLLTQDQITQNYNAIKARFGY